MREITPKSVAVLEWHGWTNFLLPRVLDDAGLRWEVDPFGPFPESQFEELCSAVSVVCFHVNLSIRIGLPLRLADLARSFSSRRVHVVNGFVEDIRKSALQRHLESAGLPSVRALRAGPADELLFVKTELNYGGETERMVPPELSARLGITQLISPQVEPGAYWTTCRGALADTVWDDPSLTVERFISNSEGSFYRVYFAGRQVIIVQAFDRSVIQKMRGGDRDVNYLCNLDDLRSGSDGLPLSSRLKQVITVFLDHTPIEFGALDIVHDGHDNHYIVDLNPTPSAPDGSPNNQLNDFLRRGIIHPEYRRLRPGRAQTVASAVANGPA